MSNNRATQRRPTKQLDPQLTIMDYFFRKEEGPDGSVVLVPRTDFVTREELYWALEWAFSRAMRRKLPWYRRLFSAAVTPFQLLRARAKVTGAAAGEAPKAAKKRIDAAGNVVDA